MGEVYLAHDPELARDVAIKVLPDDVAGSEARLARLRREARALAALNHANVATVYGFEEHAGTRVIVMELVEGETLATRLRRGPLPVPQALELAAQIARALEAAHEKGIVHRDLKPGNVMITPRGEAKVLDFGLAKPLRERSASSTDLPTSSVDATGAGCVLGTVPYMSPEQAGERRSTSAPTSGRSAASCSRCSQAGRPSTGRRERTPWRPSSRPIPIGARCPMRRRKRRGVC